MYESAGTHPHISVLPYFLEAGHLICSWAHGLMFPILQLGEKSRPCLYLCPGISGGCDPKAREQSGLHHTRTEGGRA